VLPDSGCNTSGRRAGFRFMTDEQREQ
jgi:hypothetical protein